MRVVQARPSARRWFAYTHIRVYTYPLHTSHVRTYIYVAHGERHAASEYQRRGKRTRAREREKEFEQERQIGRERAVSCRVVSSRLSDSETQNRAELQPRHTRLVQSRRENQPGQLASTHSDSLPSWSHPGYLGLVRTTELRNTCLQSFVRCLVSSFARCARSAPSTRRVSFAESCRFGALMGNEVEIL